MRFHNNPGQKIPFTPFDNSAYYNQFFNQKLKDEDIEKQQYHPQDHGSTACTVNDVLGL